MTYEEPIGEPSNSNKPMTRFYARWRCVMALRQMMTTAQVARLFGAETPSEVRTRQAYLAQLRFRGQGPRFVKHGRMILYPQDAVAEWLEAGETDCTRSMR